MSMFSNPIAIDYERINRGRIPKTERNDWIPFQFKKPEPPEFVNVADDELLLGYEPYDDDYESKVTIPINKNRRITMCIFGDNDSGKSVFAQFLINQMRYRFGRLIGMIDPKDDSYVMENPNTRPDMRNILDKYRIKPRAHRLLRIYPAFTKLLGVKGIPFIPALGDFTGLDKTSEVDRLAKYFELEKGDPSLPLLTTAMFSDDPPQTPDELLRKIKEIKKEGIGKRTEKLETAIYMKVMTEQLGDCSVNIPRLLKENGMLVLKVPLVKEQTNITDAIASLFISNIMASREKAIITGKGYIDRPTTIVCDEADKYAGSNTVTNALITQITTKFRSIRNTVGLDSMLITQHASYLDSEQVMEADYLFGVRLNMQEDIDLLRPRAGMNIYDMQETEFIIGQHPKVWWCLDKNGGIQYFKPLPTPNSMPRQKFS